MSQQSLEVIEFDLDRPLGGVITSDLTIEDKGSDYEVISDVTIDEGKRRFSNVGLSLTLHANYDL